MWQAYCRVAMKRILYLTRNGLLEPLGQSQILPYMKGLSSIASITLVSFETADSADLQALSSVQCHCQRSGIRWIQLRFRSKPRPWAPALAILQLGPVALWQSLQLRKPELVHARSYVSAAIALLLNRLIELLYLRHACPLA